MSDLYTPTRRELLRNAGRGAAVLAVAGITVATTATPAAAVVTGFRWCNRCQTMWFIGGDNNGHCPVFHLWDHSHKTDGSGAYVLRRTPEGGNGQTGWHWCWTCKAVWYYGSGERGWGTCPNSNFNSGHSFGDSVIDLVRDSYRLETTFSNNGPGGQANWCLCQKCSGLYYGGNGVSATRCPAGGNHDGTQSRNYVLRTE
ncbi:MAG: hypothetical protein M3460_04480 [Actinomycetota bacterium]|nr:hypothetical protein [Actinomycetota bacterium]